MNALLLLVGTRLALAADAPAFWYRQTVTGALFPLGALSETRVQVRTPGPRSDSIVLRNTYFGAGVRLDVSPAFVNPGVQVSLAPVDVFDVDLSAEFLGFLPGPFGTLPYRELSSKAEAVRDASPEHFATTGWAVHAAPTLKLQVGPFIALDAAAVSWLHVDRPEGMDAPLVYEPGRDMIIAWDDLYVEHQPIALWEFKHGKEGPMLAAGLTWRDRFTLYAGDRNAGVGAMLLVRPKETPAWPTFVLVVIESVIDPERVGQAPLIALQANWIGEPALPAR